MCGYSCNVLSDLKNHLYRHTYMARLEYLSVCHLCKSFACNNNEKSTHYRKGHGLMVDQANSLFNVRCPFRFAPEQK